MNNVRGGTSLIFIILIVMYLTDGDYKMAILWGLIGLGINGFGLINDKSTKSQNGIKINDEEK